MYDCVIVGMGSAGMSAGIYAKRGGLNVLMLDEIMPGENIAKISKVENYLGFKSISGTDLAVQMYEHIKDQGVPYKITKVTKIGLNDDGNYTVYTSKGEFKTRGVIIAGGRKFKKSGLPNEDKYIGKGISYCAICDAPLYKNKKVAVLGHTTAAIEEASYLSRIASHVYLITNYREPEKKIVEENISVSKSTVVEILGEDYVSGLKLNDGTTINCDGVFVYYGNNADSSFTRDLDITDENGYIIVDNNMKTKHDRIYACGDIIKKELYQIVTAVSEGAIAATCLKKQLAGKKENE